MQNGNETATAELYNPQTGQWRNTRIGGGGLMMNGGRRDHRATKLQDGRVLITGGAQGSMGLNSAEIFDPATETFTSTNPMNDARSSEAVLLNDGRVLVVGGNYYGLNSPPATAEVYSPGSGTSGTWTKFAYTFPGFAGRPSLSAAVIKGGSQAGKVLVAGGAYVNNVDLFDPVNNTWRSMNPMLQVRSTHSVHALPNGKVLIVGGNDGSTASYTAELYDPAANSGNGSTTLVPGNLTVGGWLHSAITLPNGNVFIAGGQSAPPPPNTGNSTPNAQLYDYVANSFNTAAPMLLPRVAFPIVHLPATGQLLIPGGANIQSGGSSVTVLRDVELRVP